MATDVAPNAEAALKRFVEAAWPALKRLDLSPSASQSKLTFKTDLAAAVEGADLVQENGPERIDFKKKLYGQLDELLPPDVVIASSSSRPASRHNGRGRDRQDQPRRKRALTDWAGHGL